MAELMDIRLHQQIAHEIYRQQMLQRLPDPYPSMLPVPAPHSHHRAMHQMPPQQRYGLPGAQAKLQNNDLWSQFHQIGTEMIITKSGRRMFPSLRISLSGLEDDANYCVLLEMVPRGDCRYKFSGSQWVPAGGAEPQSTQRMYLHPDSPALGSHWAAQPVLFNKVKLTNNTLDSCGHIVLTSMHKYQPRLHIIRTTDPSQIPWAPQQAFFFPETEFVAVTAYQNDRITKLKIDNNPFAKGFRESGQSRCKRKLVQSPSSCSSSNSPNNDDDVYDDSDATSDIKRKRSNSCSGSVSSLEDSGLSVSELSSGTSSPVNNGDIEVCNDDDHPTTTANHSHPPHHLQSHELQQQRNSANYSHLLHSTPYPPQFQHDTSAAMLHFRDAMQPQSWMDLAFSYFTTRNPYPQPMYHPSHPSPPAQHAFHDMRMLPGGAYHSSLTSTPTEPFADTREGLHLHASSSPTGGSLHSPTSSQRSVRSGSLSPPADCPATSPARNDGPMPNDASPTKPVAKKCGFSISAILGEK